MVEESAGAAGATGTAVARSGNTGSGGSGGGGGGGGKSCSDGKNGSRNSGGGGGSRQRPELAATAVAAEHGAPMVAMAKVVTVGASSGSRKFSRSVRSGDRASDGSEKSGRSHEQRQQKVSEVPEGAF